MVFLRIRTVLHRSCKKLTFIVNFYCKRYDGNTYLSVSSFWVVHGMMGAFCFSSSFIFFSRTYHNSYCTERGNRENKAVIFKNGLKVRGEKFDFLRNLLKFSIPYWGLKQGEKEFIAIDGWMIRSAIRLIFPTRLDSNWVTNHSWLINELVSFMIHFVIDCFSDVKLFLRLIGRYSIGRNCQAGMCRSIIL